MIDRTVNKSTANLLALTKNPIALLLIAGALIGFNLPLGKIAGAAGVSPVLWAFVVSLGASVTLLVILLVNGRLTLPKGRMVRYVIISGLISFVAPNILLFTVIPLTGAGYTGLMFALSPIFTVVLASLFRLKTPNTLGFVGIAVGLVGAAIISIARSASLDAPAPIWVAVAALIPAALACGNIYRTLDWPEDASPDILAFWSHAFAVLVYVVLMLLTEQTIPLQQLGEAPGTAIAQALVAGATFPVFFRLQQQAGPVLLSQVGYIAAAVSLVTATILLGEHYSDMTWFGAGLTAVAIGITITAQRKMAR